ncbi:CDP-2,3-bis-(O-geranylgeranyl)-sn-glycerol synthase [Methanocalculus sp.]|uniref:CDP-2,3-bis-(O-geranylgeranyl)-sn-glycerol synthase n=1 Tax=Methanocalculus sp. TaxID=2004547 RepID=UPI0025F29D57|nr:CDP-2,3-bis-(O-geranylgeranyl)-sn-glycerol synthase [Methanocalculus sp.]
MLPAYLPNPVAAALGGGRPVDGGRCWRDGRRIFGDGKTLRGFLAGVAGGVVIGLIQIFIQSRIGLWVFPEHTLMSITLLAVGALLGDLAKSFLKRRKGVGRGEKWPVADQFDLVIGAFIMLLIFDPGWLLSAITLPIAIAILILTPILHRGTNIIGYILGIKDVPW